jgi:FtsH-binding integral membrane protein
MEYPKISTDPRFTKTRSAAEVSSRFMSRVYAWMTAGIALSGVVAWEVAQDPEVALRVVGPLFLPIVLAQLAAVFALSLLIRRISAPVAAALYLVYAGLTGLTMSVVFLVYTKDSVASVFWITAFSFSGLSATGYFTKRDLGPIGSFCTMGLFGLIGYGLLSMFFPGMQSAEYGMVSSLVGVIVFAGLTAYDTQKIKLMNEQRGTMSAEDGSKAAIFGALTLYLDFVNLFLSLMRLMGKRK